MPSTDLERVVDKMRVSTDKDEAEVGERLYALLPRHNGEIERSADLSQDAELADLLQVNTQARLHVEEARQTGTKLKGSLAKIVAGIEVVAGAMHGITDTMKLAREALSDVDRMMDECDAIESVLREDNEKDDE